MTEITDKESVSGSLLPDLIPHIYHLLQNKIHFLSVGVTGFEPATSRPPAVRSNQTEPHPDDLTIIYNLMSVVKDFSVYHSQKRALLIL